MEKTITVFTPTFNRAFCLGDLYESLLHQTNKDFLWLIIDDGSSDATDELVQRWKDENQIEIHYFYKENGGMHTAHNLAYEHLHTELSVCIDSDDMMTHDAIEKILSFWEQNKSDQCGGIYALDEDKKGNIIGEKFPDDLKSFQGWGCKYIFYGENNEKKVKITGDKKFISVTKILKKYPPIPVFEGEKYYSLYYKQYFIERDYTILILNEPVCIVEYLADGSSLNMTSQYLKNPRGFQHLRLLMMNMAPSFEIRFTQAIHYINSCLILGHYNFWRGAAKKGLITLAIPFGFCLYLLTMYQNYQNKKHKR
ncbi:glycosyltransferase family 2 protein [Flavobacterium lacus]|uniref:Glycosyltransferase involved in cell wall biosynthesis n=1 Tax=Flavobacterium lacus TaxID=1353778 RepID=A0A328X4H7_9FLAO|nr:glycosyltransferase family 2 protein [Flavobacterium lacus]RAR51134.1 glycosyltransferase involved in cell wall biosynthesis [Flavobacterium lacus]